MVTIFWLFLHFVIFVVCHTADPEDWANSSVWGDLGVSSDFVMLPTLSEDFLLDNTTEVVNGSGTMDDLVDLGYYLNGSQTHRISSSVVAVNNTDPKNPAWPTKHAVIVEGDVVLGGLMMVHEREDSVTCGPIMPQGGVQALEAMLYTLDRINAINLLPNITLGAHILDDCDKDTYGLEMALDFIKGNTPLSHTSVNMHFSAL